MEQKYTKNILKILIEINPSVRSVLFQVIRKNMAPLKTNFKKSPITENEGMPFDQLYNNKESGLNNKYLLDNYIVGSFNDVAFAAGQAIINNPGLSYNPFFVYGPSGLGKTHLLQGIGNTIKKRHSDKNVFYTSLEKFYMEYVAATTQNKINSFKDKYRKFDVFIMDDIQFITGKEKTQEEIFHIFNIMYESNKQIIFSADVHPNKIVGLDERIRTRFNQGMVVDISYPSVESRLAIIKNKASQHQTKIDDKILDFIATNINASIRELEGVLINIIGQTQIKGQITLKDVEEQLKSKLKAKRNVSINDVVKKVCEYYKIKEEHIYNKTRKKEVIKPRQIIMYLLREHYDVSYPTIGEHLGGRDHTTVIHSYEKIKNDILTDDYLNKDIINILNNFNY
ncbi:MAG: chromosomal replication initiator protein DnaA [Cyanobium sp. MAG06]|nr:chromosomal replication initiator protein DnaA [Cyanobium sp. MAG06]